MFIFVNFCYVLAKFYFSAVDNSFFSKSDCQHIWTDKSRITSKKCVRIFAHKIWTNFFDLFFIQNFEVLNPVVFSSLIEFLHRGKVIANNDCSASRKLNPKSFCNTWNERCAPDIKQSFERSFLRVKSSMN